MPMTRIPTLAEIDALLSSDMLEPDSESIGILSRLAACLREGAAILSREDREQAMVEAVRHGARSQDGPEDICRRDALRLLQLEPKP